MPEPRLDNDRLLRALAREPVDRTPVWIMRQAGRYLPEYRETRERAGSFMQLCSNPELACEVTLQPLARFPLDAAILFSDILTIPDAMGLGLRFVEGEGPVFDRPLRSRSEILKLAVPEPDVELRYVTDAVALIRRELAGKVPLIGFAGSPWTLATYMVEGASTRDFARVKALAYSDPSSLRALLDTLVAAVTRYLNAQVEAGAQALMLFDTWGGALTPDGYARWSLRPMREIVAGLKREHEGRRVPVIVFTKGGGQWLEAMADSGADALGIDWTTGLDDARRRVGDRVALQGNLDPSVLYAQPDDIRREVAAVLDAFGDGPGLVFNLGHGIHPGVDPDKVAVMVDAVHSF